MNKEQAAEKKPERVTNRYVKDCDCGYFPCSDPGEDSYREHTDIRP